MADQTLNPQFNFYQSANVDADEIKRDFIVRKREFDIIMDDIRHNPMKGSVQHYLMLGRRGSGKSTLLRRIQVEVNNDETLKKHLIAINPAEEQANIYRLYDLWETVKEELEHEGVEVDEPDEDNDSSAYARNLFAVIHAAIERSGKKIVLLLDNIDRIFENLKEDAGLLREILLNYDDIKIIGGSTRMTEHFWKYNMPFYEFFRILKLEPLTSDEIKQLLTHWSEKYNLEVLKEFAEKRTGQLEAVRILTDGLPRTLLLFVNILLTRENGTGFEYIKMIMDRVTPLYQERLNNLPPAQRKIVLQLAFLWEAVGAREVAEAAHMEVKVVSAQLSQLADNNIVEKVDTGTKNNLYRLSERFFNLWLIFTQGSPREKRRAKYLTIFLESFYAADEMKSLALKHLQCIKDMEPGKAALLTKAFAQSKYISSATRDELIYNTIALKGINDEWRKQLPLATNEIISEIEKLTDKYKWNQAIAKANEIEQEDGIRYFLLGLIHDRWRKYEDIYCVVNGSENPYEVREDNVAYNATEKIDLAEKYYLKAIEKEDAKAMNNLALLYKNQNKYDLAEQYYLKAIEKENTITMFNLAILYQDQNKYDLAEEYYLKAIEKGDAMAMNNLALLYKNQNKYDLAEQYYLKAIEKENTNAMFNLAILYQDQNKYDLAEEYYLKAIEKGDKSAIFNLALLYSSQNKFDLEEHYYLKAIEKGHISSSRNLALSYYTQNKNKDEAFELIGKVVHQDNSIEARFIFYAIKVWRGEVNDIADDLKEIIKQGDYPTLDILLAILLTHYQTNLVYNLFTNTEFGEKLRDEFQPLYYATALLAKKESNIALKIPPELKETVDEILQEIKESQEYYYPSEKK